MLDRKFKPPPRDDLAAWSVVRRLVAAGFRYSSIYEADERGGMTLVPNPYPTRAADVDAFITRFRRHRRR